MANGGFIITNTGTTGGNFTFSAYNGCDTTLYLNSGETYYIVANTTTLTDQGDITATFLEAVSNRYASFSGSCGNNFSIFTPISIFFDGFLTGLTIGDFYCFSGLTGCTGSPSYNKQYYDSDCYECIQTSNTFSYSNKVYILPMYSFSGTNVNDCLSVCPCCGYSKCINETGFYYDDNYSHAGSYNGKSYWTGQTNGHYIYYSSANTQWCLSLSLGGSCLMFGKSPCTSDCPDLCDSYYSDGICPTPTPTPTINCNNLDFEAIFNCEVTPTPSITPTNSATPTLTPTPTQTNPCGYFNVVATIDTFTPTPSPTPTNTPTPSPEVDRPFNFSGNVTFNTINAEIKCPISKKFQDCFNGMIYYTTDTTDTPGNVELQDFMIFKGIVDGQVKCISYIGADYTIIGTNQVELVEGPIGFSNLGDCAFCVPQITQTPTPTPTPTMTQTLTPSPTPTLTRTPTPSFNEP